MKAVYVLLTRTHTKFGAIIRRFGKTKFNHCALALDSEFTQLYSFARPSRHGVLLAKLVRETKDRYTCGESLNVHSCVIKIQVSDEEYEMITNRIAEIENDEEYMYNYMSILTYPFKGGMSGYKSYTCVEFVASLMKLIDYSLNKDACHYLPDDLYAHYQDRIEFEGDLRNYMTTTKRDDFYFKGLTWGLLFLNVIAIEKIIRRILLTAIIDIL